MDAIEKEMYDNVKYGTNNSEEAMEKISGYLEAVVVDPDELSHLRRWLDSMRYVYHCEME